MELSREYLCDLIYLKLINICDIVQLTSLSTLAWLGIPSPTVLNLFVLASPVSPSQLGICRGLQR